MRKLFGTSTPAGPRPAPTQPTGRDLLIERELYARWYMDLRLDEEAERARRYERPLSLLLAGPALLADETPTPDSLQAAASAARTAARAMDLVGWVDSATILMVLPETTTDEARAAASRLRSEMWLRSRSFGGQKWEIRLATGTSSGASGGERIAELLSQRGSFELAA
ncbi:MAG: hypothetical protein IVW36_07025 [Dehalococcoidia bacterium]|nr:hypothetical protein [Dehalococcoidia bacterium]